MTRAMRIGTIMGTALALAGAVVACDSSDGDTGPGDTTNGTENSVVEVNLTSGLAFTPADLTIEVGTTVRWVNDAAMFHTITPDGHSEWSRQEMTSAGQTFEHTFGSEGTFPYYCEPHQAQGMAGTITVEAAGDSGIY